MALQRTRFSPNTCGCVLDYQWDDTVAEAVRTHTIVAHTPCATHFGLPTTVGKVVETDVATIHPMEQNQRVNKFVGAALEALTDLRDGVTGNFTLKNGIELQVTWTGTGSNRVLNVLWVGVTLTNAKKTTLQTRADQLFGAGKVVVL